MADLINALSQFADWLLKVLEFVPKWIWSECLKALASVINAIPVPGFVSQVQGFWNGVPSGIWYFVGWMHLGWGVSALLSAYVIRFLIRRIPVVG